MSCYCKIHSIISHIISQLTYRRVATAAQSCSEHQSIDLHGLERSDYVDFIKGEIQPGPLVAPWVPLLNASLGGLVNRVVDSLMLHLKMVRDHGCHVITQPDARYPQGLWHLHDPPHALTVKGDPSLFLRPRIGIIGARKASEFAYREAQKIAFSVSQAGHVVVSGGALGCDQAAHQGAIMSQQIPAPTIVVMASGLHEFYPATNHQLFAVIEQRRGLFVSERLFWMTPRPFDFPIRNRIIAALSDSLVVMQASKRSGALVTACHGLDLGREVFVLQHPEGDVRAEGSRQLIDEGALGFMDHRHLFGGSPGKKAWELEPQQSLRRDHLQSEG